MFTPTEHEYVNTVRQFVPQGFSPYDPELIEDDGKGVLVLPAYGLAFVESAWFRNAFEGDTMILLYVQSLDTGLRTHIPDYELANPSIEPVEVGFDDEDLTAEDRKFLARND